MCCARAGCICRRGWCHAFDHGFIKPKGSMWVGGFKEWEEGIGGGMGEGWVGLRVGFININDMYK